MRRTGDELRRLAACHGEAAKAADEWERLRVARDEALVAAESAGYTHQEMADVMGVSRGRVGQLLADARRRFE